MRRGDHERISGRVGLLQAHVEMPQRERKVRRIKLGQRLRTSYGVHPYDRCEGNRQRNAPAGCAA